MNDYESIQEVFHIVFANGTEQNRLRAQEFLRNEVGRILSHVRSNDGSEDENKLLDHATIAIQGVKVIDTITNDADEKNSFFLLCS